MSFVYVRGDSEIETVTVANNSNDLEKNMQMPTWFRSKVVGAAILITLAAASCGGDKGGEDQLLAAIDELNAQVEELEEQLDSDTQGQADSSASQADETNHSTNDSGNSGTSDDTNSRDTAQGTESESSGESPSPEAEGPADNNAQEATDDQTAAQPEASDDQTAAQPEASDENCESVKDRNELRLDIESPAIVIDNNLAKPGDECDFHILYIDGMSRGVNSNGIVQLSITCENAEVVEVALAGPGGFDYRHGASNGQRYSCGDTWAQTVNYQSDIIFFTVYIRPLEESGASSYQVVALPIPT